MLLGLISLLLAQSARWISEICVDSSLFTSQFYICSEQELGMKENIMLESSSTFHNETTIPKGLNSGAFHQCGEVTCCNCNLLVALFIVLSLFHDFGKLSPKEGERDNNKKKGSWLPMPWTGFWCWWMWLWWGTGCFKVSLSRSNFCLHKIIFSN